jgi:hypothetical protein
MDEEYTGLIDEILQKTRQDSGRKTMTLPPNTEEAHRTRLAIERPKNARV